MTLLTMICSLPICLAAVTADIGTGAAARCMPGSRTPMTLVSIWRLTMVQMSIAERLRSMATAWTRWRRRPPQSPEAIIVAAVVRATGVTEAELRGRGRRRRVADARHLTWWLLHRLLGHSASQLGRDWGRHHATVLSALDKVDHWHRERAALRDDLYVELSV